MHMVCVNNISQEGIFMTMSLVYILKMIAIYMLCIFLVCVPIFSYLQIKIVKTKKGKLGLVLPIIVFVYSIIIGVGLGIMLSGISKSILLGIILASLTFLLINIFTFILWHLYRKESQKN